MQHGAYKTLLNEKSQRNNKKDHLKIVLIKETGKINEQQSGLKVCTHGTRAKHDMRTHFHWHADFSIFLNTIYVLYILFFYSYIKQHSIDYSYFKI